MSCSRALSALTLVAALITLLVPASATAAVPASGAVSPAATTVKWSGGPFVTSNPTGICATSLDPACDTFALTIEPPSAGDFTVDIAIAPSSPGDLDLYVYDSAGKRVASSATETGNEKVTLTNPAGGRYTVRTVAWLVDPGTSYEGSATMSVASAPIAPEPGSVLWSYDKTAPQASVDVPLRVVMVGFQPGDVDAAKILGEIPNVQRPGVLTPRGTSSSPDEYALLGADTLVNHGRAYYRNSKPFLVPYEYRWKPELIYAPTGFTSGLFSAMMASSSTGEFSNDRNRAYLEQYNTARGVYRGIGNEVPANAPVRFVNGEAVEDWIAANSATHLGFDFAARGKGPGRNPGYTVFILNTWDSPEAKALVKPEHEYHVFKINRTDPDTKQFDGIDWARVWGGRYRFMMVDLGAAPNPYEAETWGNRNRSTWGSANYDPPLWEYRANAPRPTSLAQVSDGVEQAVTPGETFDRDYMNFMLGRTVNQAASFRFLHSYLYEPWPGTGQFWLSDNVWHDKFAEVPWPSDLTKLYDQNTVIRGLSTLTPYFNFGGDVRYEYLSDDGHNHEHAEDQANLQDAKAKGDDIAGTPFTAMNTKTTMDYLDSKPNRFLRGAPCATSVPGINVVVEKHYAWALPVIVAGIATNRDGVPWGYMNSVSDLTKYGGADRDAMLSIAHPQAFSGAFTYTAIHEASHYLGVAHPHDSIGATRNEDGSPLYYDGFTWAFNSTAAPSTYSHTELVYSILDQENVARGHATYYLKWSDEALTDGGQAYYDRGLTTVGQLTPEAQALRKSAIAGMVKAEKLFAKFDFVKAVYAAQGAWRDAAAYRDLALGLAPGTSELEKGTKLAGAESCPSAKR